MTATVSVIIPCYNAVLWLANTIASVRAQTWKHYEIILVDDGSNDGSGELADHLAGPDMKVIHQANAGQSAAFNRGLALAQGDYFEYLDADDLLAPDKLQVQVERLRALPQGWIASGSWGRFTNDPAQTAFVPEPVWRDLDPVEWLVTSWRGGGMMHGACWLVPRAVAQAAGPWNERLSLVNDFEYFSRVLLASQGVAFCGGARTFYRSGIAGSLSASSSRKAWESAFLAIELGTRSLLAREDSPRTRAAAARCWQALVHAAYPFVPDLVRKGETEVRRLGGSDLAIGGGPLVQGLRRLFGWKLARRTQVLGRRVLKRK